MRFVLATYLTLTGDRLMRSTETAILLVITLAIFASLSLADVPFYPKVTMFFEMDQQPYDRPVEFRIRCYGFACPGGPCKQYFDEHKHYKPKEVYSISGGCPRYGCRILHPALPRYTRIDYCNLEAKTAKSRYRVDKFGDSPVGECSRSSTKELERGYSQDCELRIDLLK